MRQEDDAAVGGEYRLPSSVRRHPSTTPHHPPPPPPRGTAVGRVAIVLPFPHPPVSSSRRWQRCCSPRACRVRGGRGGGAGGVPGPRWLRTAAR
ncbi:Os07g0416825 [Oryza sativa Japonica Group]|uniref:Os07g0416825 protein n=1 Tax=Oryza sativa subsp. japonica TaxID=39947 RepID=A0A0P0X5G4_ORYSJ|nr:Os07g0416825 [Oryza sativa Japonica Group]